MEAYSRTGKVSINHKQVRVIMKSEVKSWKEHRLNRVRDLDFAAGTVVGKAKRWHSTMTCDLCGGLMDLIDVDRGYSCRDEFCDGHVEGE